MSSFLLTQTSLEHQALRLLEHPDVHQALTTLARRWREGTPGFAPETYAQLPDSLSEVALLVALQVVNTDPHRPEIVEISTGPHVWGGLAPEAAIPGSRWGINNPDTLYFAAPLAADSTYVLRGRVTGVPPTDLNVSVQHPDVWWTLDSLGLRDLSVESDGHFAVVVGNQPTSAGPNQLPIREGGTVLLIRQTLADWTRELPYALSIERVTGPAPGAPPSPDAQVHQLVERLATVIEHSLEGLQPPIFSLPANVVPQPGAPGDKPGYLVAQRNTLGHFRLSDDEALILEISPGGAGYVAIAAPNVWGVTADSEQHQNSLNNVQVEAGPDGRITVVVSNTDPGVVNWVDPGGLREGIVMLRWQLLDQDPAVTEQPAVMARHVRIANLPELLPTAARQSGSDSRRDQLAVRAAAYARRFDRR